MESVMNLQDVKNNVLKIYEMKGDDESAHSEEDNLHQEVLRQVANGNPEAKEMAKEALKTLEIDFCRWCA
jgi:hypothetical protein